MENPSSRTGRPGAPSTLETSASSFILLVEEPSYEAFTVIQKVPGQGDVFKGFVGGLSETVLVEAIDGGAGVCEDDGGVRRDEELGTLPNEVVKTTEEGQLTGGRKCSFGLVQNVEPLRLRSGAA